MKIPEEARLAVKEVTMDLSSSMRAIVSTVFPNATIVLDCFHVLKRCHDAIEEVRCKKQVFDQQFSEKLISADFGKLVLHIVINKAVMRQRAAASLLGA